MRDEAAGSIVSFLVAGSIFVLAIGTLFVFTTQVGKTSVDDLQADQQRLQAQADSLLNTLVRTPGAPTGFGLRAASNVWLTVTNLADRSDDNDTAYGAWRTALGVPADLGFHVRLLPKLRDLDSVLASPLDLRVGYFPSKDFETEERAMLRELVGNPNVDPPNAPFEDNHDVLVIGTNPTPQDRPDAGDAPALMDFLDLGGLVIVLGENDDDWLPAAGCSTDCAGGPMVPLDSNHPLVTIPNPLPAQAFATEATDFAAPGPAFDVIARDAAGNAIIAVSKAGAFGSGRVVVANVCGADPLQAAATPCEPSGAATCTGEAREGCRLLHNLLVQRFSPLFFDYGPPISTPAGSASATVLVCVPPMCSGDPVLAEASAARIENMVPATLSVYVFH